MSEQATPDRAAEIEAIWRLPVPSGRCHVPIHTYRLQVLSILGEKRARKLLNEFQLDEVVKAERYLDSRVCTCGHPFAGAHRTPGTECAVYGCDCPWFREAAPDEDGRR